MPFSRVKMTLLFWLSTVSVSQVLIRQSCAEGYNLCSPPDATADNMPPFGPELGLVYLSVVETVNHQTDASGRRICERDTAPEKPESADTICCAQTTDCKLLQDYRVPMCWDRFTTNFYLPDGSYGSTTTGNYTSASGNKANLITGDYQLQNGDTGNLYRGHTYAQPNTSSLSMPTPWTSSGIGTAIPASDLGAQTTSNSFAVSVPLSTSITTSAALGGYGQTGLNPYGNSSASASRAVITSSGRLATETLSPMSNNAAEQDLRQLRWVELLFGGMMAYLYIIMV